jgi:hypothetical protein
MIGINMSEGGTKLVQRSNIRIVHWSTLNALGQRAMEGWKDSGRNLYMQSNASNIIWFFDQTMLRRENFFL